MGGADHSEAGEQHDDAMAGLIEERGVDRTHNRETLSAAAMTEMLRDLQDAMLALDERLAALESSQNRASDDTRGLARGVAEMGEALARRVRALEQGGRESAPILALPVAAPPRRRRGDALAWVAGLIFVMVVALAAFWLLRAESVDRPTVAATLQAASAPPGEPPAPAARPASQTIGPHTVSHTVVATHAPASASDSSADTLSQSGSTPAATVSGHYAPGPSAAAPHPPR